MIVQFTRCLLPSVPLPEESMGSRARHRGCREMVRGVDPFKWPKGTCDAAIGTMGAEYDDASCYPAVWR